MLAIVGAREADPTHVATGHGPRATAASRRTPAHQGTLNLSSAVFPLVVSADRRNLVDASGRPFLIQGDSAWSLAAELSKEDTIRYLDDREQRGFNTILFSVIEAAFTHHSPPWTNAEGDVPFADMNDWTTANDSYFAHVDWLLRELEARGMLALAVPAYIGYDCGSQGWCEQMFANGVRPAGAIRALRRGAVPGFPEHRLDRGRRPDPVDVRGSIADGPRERGRERRRCRGRRRALSRGALGSRDVGCRPSAI